MSETQWMEIVSGIARGTLFGRACMVVRSPVDSQQTYDPPNYHDLTQRSSIESIGHNSDFSCGQMIASHPSFNEPVRADGLGAAAPSTPPPEK
jgi:hypothetical protein